MNWGKTVCYRYIFPGPLALECYEKTKMAKAAIYTAHVPILEVIACLLDPESLLLQRIFPPLCFRGSSSASQTFQQWIGQYGTADLQPGPGYFEKVLQPRSGCTFRIQARYLLPPKLYSTKCRCSQ